MPIITPVTQAQCQQECERRELGPARVIITPYCEENPKDFCIDCKDQRNDLALDFTRSFTEIPNQCSTRTKKRESGKEMMLNVSLGAGLMDPEVMAMIFDTQVVSDPTGTGCKIIKIQDAPGTCPKHFQVVVIPYKGNQLDYSFGVILDYAIAKTEQSQLVFSPSTPREFTFTLYAEPHPVSNNIGQLLYGEDGQDCQMLKTLAGAKG